MEDKRELSQEEVNDLYKKAYISLTEAGQVMGMSRQGLWYLTENGTFKMKRNENGRPFVKVQEVRAYVLKRRQELLDGLAKLKLPNN